MFAPTTTAPLHTDAVGTGRTRERPSVRGTLIPFIVIIIITQLTKRDKEGLETFIVDHFLANATHHPSFRVTRGVSAHHHLPVNMDVGTGCRGEAERTRHIRPLYYHFHYL